MEEKYKELLDYLLEDKTIQHGMEVRKMKIEADIKRKPYKEVKIKANYQE